jgi:hypothetical protein
MDNAAIYKLTIVIANKTFGTAWLITATCLYSTGHWIGGSVALALGVWIWI